MQTLQLIDFWDAQAKTSKKPVDQDHAHVGEASGRSDSRREGTMFRRFHEGVTLTQQRYYFDRAKFRSGQRPALADSALHEGVATGNGAPKCELLTKKEETFSLPGCSTWVLANAGATGYYRTGYQAEAVRALAADAETKLTPAERIALENDIWASVRVGREPVGDYLAFAQGLQSDRNRAVIEEASWRAQLHRPHLVSDERSRLLSSLAPPIPDSMHERSGMGAETGESDEQRDSAARGCSMRSVTMHAIPNSRASAKDRGQGAGRSASVDHDMAGGALRLAALNGGLRISTTRDSHRLEERQDRRKSTTFTLFTLPRFGNPELAAPTLDFAISPDVRSQDALQLVGERDGEPGRRQTGVGFHSAALGRELQKAGGPFASAEVVGATSAFCDAGLRDQVNGFLCRASRLRRRSAPTDNRLSASTIASI